MSRDVAGVDSADVDTADVDTAAVDTAAVRNISTMAALNLKQVNGALPSALLLAVMITACPASA